jgi:DNA-binding MarR family transcriptional regulator
VFERRVRAFGLTRAQWLVIARVHRRPGLSQSEVADLLEIEKASAGRLIDRMEAKGWLERRGDMKDRRVNRLHLTSKAEQLHAFIWPIAEATVDEALGHLSHEERCSLTNLMTRVKVKLQALAEHDGVQPGLPQEQEAEDREAQVS